MGTDPVFRKKERLFRLMGNGVCPLLLFAAASALAEVRLPEGPAKPIIEAQCTKCHGLENLARSGYSREGWRNSGQACGTRRARLRGARRFCPRACCRLL